MKNAVNNSRTFCHLQRLLFRSICITFCNVLRQIWENSVQRCLSMLPRPKIHGFLQYTNKLLIKLKTHNFFDSILKESAHFLMAIVKKEKFFPRKEVCFSDRYESASTTFFNWLMMIFVLSKTISKKTHISYSVFHISNNRKIINLFE